MRKVSLIAVLLWANAAFAEKDKLDAGDEAPNFASKTLNSEASKVRVFTLDSVVGPEATDKKKAVLVSFIAAACESCKKELAFLQALQNEYRDKGLLVVSIAVDRDDTESKKVADAVAKIDFPVVNDRFNIVANRYFEKKPPQLHVIDDAGKITKTAINYDESANGDILSEVRKTLGLPVSDPTPASLVAFMRAPRPTETVTAVAAEEPKPQAAAEEPKGKKGKKPKAEKKAKTAKAAPVEEKKGPKRIGRPK